MMVIVLFLHLNASAQVEKYLAAFTYQICKSVTWPSQSNDFVIAVLGDSDVTPYFKQLVRTQKLGNSSMKLVEWANLNEITSCNVLFLSKEQSTNLSAITKRINNLIYNLQ